MSVTSVRMRPFALKSMTYKSGYASHERHVDRHMRHMASCGILAALTRR